MKKNFEEQSLRNFTENKHSRTEYHRIEEWFLEEENSGLKEAMHDHWQKLPDGQPLNSRLNALLEILKTQILFTLPQKKWSVFNVYQKVAAVLFIPLLAGISMWGIHSVTDRQTAMVTIHSAEGTRTEFVLPDGSQGWLNSESDLTYAIPFSENREVELQGEAFFNVVHQNDKKFCVKTSELTVQVLGTSFDVSAYKDDPTISVILKEGSVQVLSPGEKLVYSMSPDEKLEYTIQKKSADVSRVNATEQTFWTQGILQFRGEPLSEVMKKLGRWYNVCFEIRDQQIQGYSFNATFQGEQLEEILRMIALTTPMKYRVEERITDENGIYKKKKIIIERK